MPTARELLDQADALMRRNRNRGRDDGPATLTDALGVHRDGVLAPTIILPDAARSDATPIGPDVLADADPIALDTLADVPVLTDVVDVWPAARRDAPAAASPPIANAPTDDAPAGTMHHLDSTAETPASEAPEAIPVRAVALHDAPAASARPNSAPASDEEFILDIPPATAPAPEAAAPPIVEWPPHEVPEPPPQAVTAGVDWDAMAEEIRMQVLQRLDLFTDTGLRDQLGARLQPIVDRASAELVATINRELGELVRGYVADAIEREIESWRKRGT